MPLNQLLHDDQVTRIRATVAKNPGEAEGYRRRLPELNDKFSHYPLRGHKSPVEDKPTASPLPTRALSVSLDISTERLAGIDHWAKVWGTSRIEAVMLLVDRGIGQTSTLMRAS